MTRYWFKPKSYGYGATPTTWQGWAVTLAFVLTVFILTAGMLGENPSPLRWLVWFILLALAILGMTWLARLKTDGEWRWRWGRSDTGKML